MLVGDGRQAAGDGTRAEPCRHGGQVGGERGGLGRQCHGTGVAANLTSLVRAALAGTTASTLLEIWFQDEARVGQQGSHA